MKFVKMHGCGNDYVYLDALTDAAILRRMAEPTWTSLVQRMSDRHKGIGSDGVIVLCPPTGGTAEKSGKVESGGTGSSPARGGANTGVGSAHVRMRMFNADGSESEMCGNGIRCVAKFAHDRLGVTANPMSVETGRGLMSISYELDDRGKVRSAMVDMGEPILDHHHVPVDHVQISPGTSKGHVLRGFGEADDWVFVSMGNPHSVTWMLGAGERSAEPGRKLAELFGPRVERHPAFPNRTNMHIVRNVDRAHAEVFTWERGAGVTQACGTGVCASVEAGVLNGRLDREVLVLVLGGELRIRWDEATNHVFMTGEAVDVFEGVWMESSPT